MLHLKNLDVIMTYFKVLPQYFSGGTAENHVSFQSTDLSLKIRTSYIPNKINRTRGKDALERSTGVLLTVVVGRENVLMLK
jgi:hypothetical protein